MEARNVIIRHGVPSILDEAPIGSLCLVKHIYDMDLYLQINNDSQAPLWELVSNVKLGTEPDIIDRILEDRLKSL